MYLFNEHFQFNIINLVVKSSITDGLLGLVLAGDLITYFIYKIFCNMENIKEKHLLSY